jgi:hypothetical protein
LSANAFKYGAQLSESGLIFTPNVQQQRSPATLLQMNVNALLALETQIRPAHFTGCFSFDFARGAACGFSRKSTGNS